jgi:hypothetical protein
MLLQDITDYRLLVDVTLDNHNIIQLVFTVGEACEQFGNPGKGTSVVGNRYQNPYEVTTDRRNSVPVIVNCTV